MKISIISFTQTGFLLSHRIAACYEKGECRIYTRCEACKEEKNYYIVLWISETGGIQTDNGKFSGTVRFENTDGVPLSA